MLNFLQSLKGTVWQEHLLFLQQNTDTYRWVAVGVIAGLHLLIGLCVLYIGRLRLRCDVGSSCFIPGVNILILISCFLKDLFSSTGSKPKKVKEPKKSKSNTSDDVLISLSDDDDVIDLF